MFCPECGSDLFYSTLPIEFELHGETVVVEGIEHERCPQCGENLLSLDASVRLQREATELCRAKKGYLSGKQIKAVRERAGYSQEELERLIKAGPKSFTRWEKGTALQKGPTDVLLRILDRFPIVVEWLQGSTPSLGQKHIEVAPAHNTPVASESDKGLAA